MNKYTFLHTKGVQITVEAIDADDARVKAGQVATDCQLPNPEDLSIIAVSL